MGESVRPSPLPGILMLLAGVGLGAVNGAVFKALTQELPGAMVVFCRFASYLSIILPIALWKLGLGVFFPARVGLHVVRGILQCGATLSFVGAVTGMPVADAIAILYIYPFLLTALAPFMLGERVGIVSWLGVGGGFVGVIIVMRPDFHTVNTHALWAVLCGVFVALQLILGRQLSAVTGVLGMSAFGGLVGAILLGLYMPFVWHTPTGHAWWLIVILGSTTAANLSLILFAFSRVEASVLAPFTYFEILAGVLVGFLWFGDVPDAVSWTGIGIILVSGGVVAHFQHRSS